jgi:hypothetical protein
MTGHGFRRLVERMTSKYSGGNDYCKTPAAPAEFAWKNRIKKILRTRIQAKILRYQTLKRSRSQTMAQTSPVGCTSEI